MYALLGLNLLRLLSQNRLSDFHTALEAIEPDQLQNNAFIKQAVDLEQFLMEGSYNKVWNSRKSVQGEEFLFFYDVLMNTIREEIANCSEKAYDSLPLQDASTLLFLKNTQELMTFAEQVIQIYIHIYHMISIIYIQGVRLPTHFCFFFRYIAWLESVAR